MNLLRSPLVWLVAGVLLSLAGATYYLHGQLQDTASELATKTQEAQRLSLRVQEANGELDKLRTELELQQKVVTDRDRRNEALAGELTDLQTRLRQLAADSRRNDNADNDLSGAPSAEDPRVPGVPQERCSFYDVRVPDPVIDLMRDAARAARSGSDEDRVPTGSPDATMPSSGASPGGDG